MSLDPIWIGPTNLLLEQSDSPDIDLGELLTWKQTYKGLYSLCQSNGLLLPKGTAGSGILTGFIVRTTHVRRARGNIGTLEINWAAAAGPSAWTLPPDKFGCKPKEINPRVESHRIFNTLSDAECDQVRAANNASDAAARDAATRKVTNPIAQNLLSKMKRGTESYYLAAFEYYWTFASFTAPTFVKGGYIEVPGGPLSGSLPGGLTWLREADESEFTDFYFVTTRRWVGAPVDDKHFWDTDLYRP